MEWVQNPINQFEKDSSRVTCLLDFCSTLCLIKFNPCLIN